MKFLALAALAVVSAAECTPEELEETDPAKCNVTDADTDEVTCTEVEDGVTECDEEEEEEGEDEEGSSSALFAGVASAAVAATMMF